MAFEHTLAINAHTIQQVRKKLFPVINDVFERSYAHLSDDSEKAQLFYNPDCQSNTLDQWMEVFAKERWRTGKLVPLEKDPTVMIFLFILMSAMP